jgi:hypothetical protein
MHELQLTPACPALGWLNCSPIKARQNKPGRVERMISVVVA